MAEGDLRSGADEQTQAICGDSGLDSSSASNLLELEYNYGDLSSQSASPASSGREPNLKAEPLTAAASAESSGANSSSPWLARAPAMALLPRAWLVPQTVGTLHSLATNRPSTHESYV